jgi:hypothetical protein
MNGICKILDRHYGAVPIDDIESSWNAVKVDRAGNEIVLETGFDTEEAAEQFAGEVHRQELEDNGRNGVGS